MGLPPSNIQQTREHAAGSVRSAIQGEIEALVLGRMESAGGRLAELARFRSFVGEVLGVYGTVTDIIDMAVAGYEAITIQRRMLMRVSAAHGFGYWIFKNPNIISPLNPPNSFLVLQRGLDQSDQSIGRRIGNSDFSTDGGLTANDWNSIWRMGVQETFRNLESGMRRMAQTGKLRRTL